MEHSKQQQQQSTHSTTRSSLHDVASLHRASTSLHRTSILMQQHQKLILEEEQRRQERLSFVGANDDVANAINEAINEDATNNELTNNDSSYLDDESYSGSDLDDDSFLNDGGGVGTSDEDDDDEEEDEDDDSDSSQAGIVQPQQKRKKTKIGAKEHSRVHRMRIFVFLLLTSTAIANAIIVYFLTSNKEEADYSNRVKELTDEIIRLTRENVRVSFLGMDTMSNALTTQYLDSILPSPSNPLPSQPTWPRVTFENFASMARDARNVTGAFQIIYAPIVRESERQQWELYSVQNQGWVREESFVDKYNRKRELISEFSLNESVSFLLEEGFQPEDHRIKSPNLLLQQQHFGDRQLYDLYEPHNFRGVIPARIHPAPTLEERRAVPENIYAPVWQMSPVPYYRGIINHDLLQQPAFQELAEIVNTTRQPVLSNQLYNTIVNVFFQEEATILSGNSASSSNIFQTRDEEGNTASADNNDLSIQEVSPTTVLVQPVWRTQDWDAELGGFLIALIPWEDFLVDTFREESDDSFVAQYEEIPNDPQEVETTTSEATTATSSSCPELQQDTDNPMLNYHIVGGSVVEYLGPGKNFPGKSAFDYSMKTSVDFPTRPPPITETASMLAAEVLANISNPNSNNPETDPSPEPVISSPYNCHTLQLQFSPSNDVRDRYLTNWPTYYAIMVILVFMVLATIFFLYDLLVEQRRGRVMAVAEKTNRIVTSLFPGQFADQLISENKDKSKKKEGSGKKKRKKKRVVIQEAPNRQLRKFMKDKKKHGYEDLAKTNPANLDYGDGAPDSAADSPLFLAQSKPIADLFPETTVLFADIAGFTAWSSVREPSQVFTLLETVYQNFDFLAKQYGIFKIETIGDCYVAVCGLPEPRADHAVAMSRFSLACMSKMKILVSQLEVTLGPDTGDLTMRFGLHSGPVTAGVLRGERARFQLFGDTVNTAARMESTGMRDKIQVSQETADLLAVASKCHWVVKRDGLIQAKGKGELQTYWLLPSSGTNKRASIGMTQRRASVGGAGVSAGVIHRRTSIGGSSRRSNGAGNAAFNRSEQHLAASPSERNIVSRLQSTTQDDDFEDEPYKSSDNASQGIMTMGRVLTRKHERLVNWNCELLQQFIRQIVARRNFLTHQSKRLVVPFGAMMSELPKLAGGFMYQGNGAIPLDEVVEVINLPEFSESAYHGSADAKHVQLDPMVVTQLRRFVTVLASKYCENPFHNFDHASHVAMSVSKLLSRIVAPDLASINARHANDDISSSLHLAHDMKDLHDHTYGITSDPLTQFAVILSALIHDIDHRGVPNSTLSSEEPEMALKYRGKSVAEQNSVDIAWTIFMDESLKSLRDAICPEPNDLRRLRQIIVNSVLATDIFDPELTSLRKLRWQKAFLKDTEPDMLPFGKRGSFHLANNNRQSINRKATIVIEHLIQASDVAHTMQHWHIYKKWNEYLFQEMYKAYEEGRADKDPSDGWYKGEIWFFDNYVIPLAKKLKDCGVFGVSSDEYLTYATANRSEWEEKGEGIVAELISKYKSPVRRSELGYE